jgi:Uncharacterized protein conserved in bacteria (DUF2184)
MRARLEQPVHVNPGRFQGLKNFKVKNFQSVQRLNQEIRKLGIGFTPGVVEDMAAMCFDSAFRQRVYAGDALPPPPQPLVTTPSIPVPLQFLQSWLPGFVHILTAARNIDELVGFTTQADWEDEQVVQGIMELVGMSIPYGDYSNVQFSSWNSNWDYISIVRFEEGIRVGRLEAARAAKVQVNTSAEKRGAAGLALEIQRNAIGFYGYNNGANRTYGFLTDPGLPAYITVANGASGLPQWSTKTFEEIQQDILTWIVSLRTTSKDQIDPNKLDMTMALASAVVDRITTTTPYNISVLDWLNKNYPRIRVTSAPELDGANGGANVGYLYADKMMDSSTDDGKTFMQIVPAKFMALGVEQHAKYYEEAYTNATAGVRCKRPYAVYRASGL